MQTEKLGEILPRRDEDGNLIFRVAQFIGTAEDEGEDRYEMLVANDYSPIIKNVQTGKEFHLGWEDLINLARERGVDVEEAEA